ncbi:MAG: sensor histidine kinase [Clostridium fessum]
MVWMIENEQKTEAVKVVTALARFFRISLSRGKSLITVKDELEHVRNYLMIQQMRFKNKFTYTIESDDEVLGTCKFKADAAAAGGECDLPWHGIYGRRRTRSSCAPGRRKKSCIWRCGTMGLA